MSAIKGSFQVDTNNPVGRAQVIRALEKHNDLIRGTKHHTNTHESKYSKQYRKWRCGNPTWQPSDWDMYSRRATDYIMARGIAQAASTLDTSCPRVAWKHRKERDAYRSSRFTDPTYVNTAGYEVQWSQQEGIVARRYLDMHERAINTKGYVNSRINPKVVQFKKWRDRQRTAIAEPINVPMGNLHSPNKKKMRKRPSTRAGGEEKGKQKISNQSQALLDQMASRVLQSAMAAASNDNVRSMLVKAMENPSLNPLASKGRNPDKEGAAGHETKAMYKCDVITGFDARNEMELSLREGTQVFVLEDDGAGFFLAMDDRGCVGRIPSSFVHFREAVSRAQFPSQEYTLGHGTPLPGGASVSKGDFGATAGRTDFSRAMTAPPAKRTGVMPGVERLAGKIGTPVPSSLYESEFSATI